MSEPMLLQAVRNLVPPTTIIGGWFYSPCRNARGSRPLRSPNRLCPAAFLVAWILCGPNSIGVERPFDALSAEYEVGIRPILKQLCLDCHSTKDKEGELDLERFGEFRQVRRDPEAWQKVALMLANNEMPPQDSEQPSREQSEVLRGWVKKYLDAESLARAGDPGPVVLRRLNNAEYTYTIRDLTGVKHLDPAREFPADGAAGEGFTNTGNALVMSPSLLRKYLDAGQEIAAHAVLLPDGFRFSRYKTRRDWTDEILARIRSFYGRYSDTRVLGTGENVGNINVHGNTRIGKIGQLPLDKYFTATLVDRRALQKGEKTIEAVAREYGLNARYLGKLWSGLTAKEPSLLLDRLRARWREAKPRDADALCAEVAVWQKALWTFGPVGLIGRTGGPARWMEPVDPVITSQDLRYRIPALQEDDDRKEAVFSLLVTDAGDGNAQDFVELKTPRLVAEGKPEVLLRDLLSTSNSVDVKAEPQRQQDMVTVLNSSLFGKSPNGKPINDGSLCVRAPTVIEIRVPMDVASGREFVTTVELQTDIGDKGTVQVDMIPGSLRNKKGIASVAAQPWSGGTGNLDLSTFSAQLLPIAVTVNFSQVTQVFADRRDISFSRPILIGNDRQTRQRIEAYWEAFRKLFPAAICYTQIVPVDEVLTLTLFYREDDHLAELMLDASQKAELDRMWEELRFVSQSPLLHADALELLLETMSGNGQSDRSQYEAIQPLHEPYTKRAAAFRRELVESQALHLDNLIQFASRTYRRPLANHESQGLRKLYQTLRQQALPHDAAFRLTLARLLAAPEFLYRVEERRQSDLHKRSSEPRPNSDDSKTDHNVHPVSSHELAVRLSYFLWSSMPDKDLRSAADGQRLQNAETILAHTRRMLKDPRVRRLAIEFACQWLHIRQFDQFQEKSDHHFPGFASLRNDMYEESIRFFVDLFQHDRSILSMLEADHTFLNAALAAHYEIPFSRKPHEAKAPKSPGQAGLPSDTKVGNGDWKKVDGMRKYSRGGILAQATVLSKQAGASRNNPILRGDFIFETLLGQRMPRPPKNVPQLPDNLPSGSTERSLFEQHSSVAACAKCHARIDPYGFALGAFDAIGRLREKDSTGQAIDTRATLDDGSKIEGLDGLRTYLLTKRRDDFVRQFCRKLLGYALGRAVQLSDEPLLEEMWQRLEKNSFRFSEAIEAIVLSDQFRKTRGAPLAPGIGAGSEFR